MLQTMPRAIHTRPHPLQETLSPLGDRSPDLGVFLSERVARGAGAAYPVGAVAHARTLTGAL